MLCFFIVLQPHSKEAVNDTHKEKLIKIETWLLLTFFICLLNQLSSIHSIITDGSAQIVEKDDSLNRQIVNG